MSGNGEQRYTPIQASTRIYEYVTRSDRIDGFLRAAQQRGVLSKPRRRPPGTVGDAPFFQ